jgi:hypothetical protein
MARNPAQDLRPSDVQKRLAKTNYARIDEKGTAASQKEIEDAQTARFKTTVIKALAVEVN